ncbi:hypothetical protein BST61_g721 [Cercospora zeina]
MCFYRYRRWDCGCKEKFLTFRCGYADRPKVGRGHEVAWQKDTKGKDVRENGECPNGCVGIKRSPDDMHWRERLSRFSTGWRDFFYR